MKSRLKGQYFAYYHDGYTNGAQFKLFDTEEEAKDQCNVWIDEERSSMEPDDSWNEKALESICWGKVMGSVEHTKGRVINPSGDKSWDYKVCKA